MWLTGDDNDEEALMLTTPINSFSEANDFVRRFCCCAANCFQRVGFERLSKLRRNRNNSMKIIQQQEAISSTNEESMRLAATVLVNCRTEIEKRKTAKEKKEFLFQKLQGSYRGSTENGMYAKFELRIVADGEQDVCRRAFQASYGIGKFTFDELVKCLKAGFYKQREKYTDRSTADVKEFMKFRDSNGNAFDIQISRDYIANMQLPNSTEALIAQSWMDEFFTYVGDSMPNSSEIHLDSGTKKEEIFKLYRKEIESQSRPVVSPSRFYELWRMLFPHVKIREYKVKQKFLQSIFFSHFV